jgi:MoaA/NifB/PqqE/SkfB family radical SAM enzyme
MVDLPALLADEPFLAALGRAVAGGGPPLLRDAKIKITSRCNLRCEMCRYWHTRDEATLSSERWRTVLRELAALGCRKVHFSGGEVLLRPDFLELVEHAVDLGLKTNFTSNGWLLDKETARRVARAGVNSVSLSLDDPRGRLHDAIRGREGAFRRVVRAVGWLTRFARQGRPRVRINCVVMRDNYRQLPRLTALAGELGAVDLVPMPVDEKGEGRRRLSRRQIERYNRELAPEVLAIRQRLGLPTDETRVHPFGVTADDVRLARAGLYARGAYRRGPCLVPWLHLFLAWDGRAYPCCMTHGRIPALGEAATTPLEAIFHGEPYARLRRAFASGEQQPACARCDLFLRENALLAGRMSPHDRA